MKRVEKFLACAASVLVSASVTFGQDAVSLRLNSPLVAPTPPGGAAVSPLPGSYSAVLEGVLTFRIWDSLPVSDAGWAMATTSRAGLFIDLSIPPVSVQVLQPWLDTATIGYLNMRVQGGTSRTGGVPFPPIPPLPGESSFAVVVPEPGTLALLGVGAMILLHVRRRTR